MYNKGSVLLGIIIFVGLASSPIWLNLSGGKAKQVPDIKLPDKYKECVMPKEYMLTDHMTLLNEWRDLVVRQNQKYYMKDGKYFLIDGKRTELSLTRTCLKCHSDKAQFCDQCHNYLNVVPYCWDCHVELSKTVPYIPPKPKFKQARLADSTATIDTAIVFIQVPDSSKVEQAQEQKQ